MSAPAASPRRLRVLLVEDNARDAELLILELVGKQADLDEPVGGADVHGDSVLFLFPAQEQRRGGALDHAYQVVDVALGLAEGASDLGPRPALVTEELAPDREVTRTAEIHHDIRM